ncbi:MAG: primosomal protein N' [Bacilli bacterium]|nr:primosomal protein N' [Bacilli bacterium]
MKIAKVVIEHPIASLDIPFDYLIPNHLAVNVGIRVEVEFNSQLLVGYVVNIVNDYKTQEQFEQEAGFTLKNIINVIDDSPILNKELQDLATKMAYETVSPLISCYQAMLPPSLKPTSAKKVGIKRVYCYKAIDFDNLDLLTLKQKTALLKFAKNKEYFKEDINISSSILKTLIEKGRITRFLKEVYRSPFSKEMEIISGPVITKEQDSVIKEIIKSADKTFLLQGITGSGKTEVYIELALFYLALGKNVLILVPEISLTPQMVQRFKSRLKYKIAVFHSGLSQGERYDEYRRIARKEVRVVIGARSAVFAPLENIGLIVIDEEHSESYKQDNVPTYNARDIALIRASTHNSKLILGSATPSLESKARASKGVYHQLYLSNRINDAVLPKCEIVDMMKELKKGNHDLFSSILKQEIIDAISRNEQVILLLNRRGYTPSVVCRSCGYVFKCPNCDVALKYHKDTNTLNCHYCNYEIHYPEKCPNCGSKYLRNVGFGTQKIEELLQKIIPNIKVIRMDLDSVKKEKGYQKILEDFENHKYDVLLGTQMIAKGLDFENVTLVGVLNADIGLFNGDFRANERVFQLLTQVAGRAGRGHKQGKAIIQTFNPDHFVIKLASNHDYEGFYLQEMEYRRKQKYPPYRYFALIMLMGNKIDVVEKFALNLKDYFINKNIKDLSVLGPSIPYIAKVYGKQRMRLIIKYKDKNSAIKLLNEVKKMAIESNKIGISIDVDPYSEI